MTTRRRRNPDQDRTAFESGKKPSWSAGGYGHTVKIFSRAGKLKISWQDPITKKTKQKTLFSADSRELRERATRYAVTHAERLRSGELGEDQTGVRKKQLEDLTVYDVCLLYMQRVPGFPAELMDQTPSKISAWYRELPEVVRTMESTPSEATVCRDVRAFQYLFGASYIDRGEEVRPFRRDRRVIEIEPADSTLLMGQDIARGRSPRTVSNEHDRLSGAFRYVVNQYRKSIGLLYNPIDGRIADRTRAKIPRYTPAEIGALTAEVRKWIERDNGMWQVFVALSIAASGRRRQSILGLTGSDHDFEADTVIWREEHAKGHGYGRGDEVRPMTSAHRTAAAWAIKHRPNPCGLDAPLLWTKSNPARLMNGGTLDLQWKKLEKAAGVPYLRGRAIHSMRRSVVTILADALGDGKAAEYVGMTVETVRNFSYKQVQEEVMREAARSLDKKLRFHQTDDK